MGVLTDIYPNSPEARKARGARNTKAFDTGMENIKDDPEALQREAQNLLNVRNYFTSYGNDKRYAKHADPEIERRLGVLRGYGVDVDALTGTDFASGEAGLKDINDVYGTFQQLLRGAGVYEGRRYDSVSRERANEAFATGRYDASQRRLKEEIEPQQEQIRARIDEMLADASFSAEEVSRLKSDVIANNRGLAESRMNRVGAVLGLRGLDAASPAGMAVAAAEARASDSDLTAQLRKLGLDITNIEQVQGNQELDLANRLMQGMEITRNAAEGGDLDRLLQAQGSLTDLIAAIKESNIQEEYMRNAMHEAKYSGGSPWAGIAGGVVGGTAGFFLGGPMGASMGWGLGSSIGDAMGGGSGQGSSMSAAGIESIFGKGPSGQSSYTMPSTSPPATTGLGYNI